jgi:sigma-E factor negative regulatory protein RseC
MGGLFQMLFGTDVAAMCGAALGGVGDSGLPKALPTLAARESGSLSFSALGWRQTSFVLKRSLLRPGDPSGFIIFYILKQKTSFLHAIPGSKCISR